MKNIHAQTVCLRHSWYRFGSRRRRCRLCGKTWRPHPRRRGPKRKRAEISSAIRYLDNTLGSLRGAARSRKIPRETFRRRFAKSLDVFLHRARFAEIPETEVLIAIADATGVRILGKQWTLYCILLRPIKTDYAVIVPPLLLPGREGSEWRGVFKALDQRLQERICALVCDGNPRLLEVGKERGWVIQRCHFHLKAHLRSYLSWWSKGRSRIWALLAFFAIETALTTRDQTQLLRQEKVLEHLVPLLRSKKARWTIRHFLRACPQFRSYLLHPDLRLPTTSNAAESLIGLAKVHLRRTRGFTTRKALFRHIVAVFERKQTIHCPPVLQPN